MIKSNNKLRILEEKKSLYVLCLVVVYGDCVLDTRIERGHLFVSSY